MAIRLFIGSALLSLAIWGCERPAPPESSTTGELAAAPAEGAAAPDHAEATAEGHAGHGHAGGGCPHAGKAGGGCPHAAKAGGGCPGQAGGGCPGQAGGCGGHEEGGGCGGHEEGGGCADCDEADCPGRAQAGGCGHDGEAQAAHAGHGHHGDDGPPCDEDAPGIPDTVGAFHEVMAPVWHSPPGPQRGALACSKLAEMQAAGAAMGSTPAPENLQAQAARWAELTAGLVSSVDTLATACPAGNDAQSEAKFSEVHEAFHAAMAMLRGGVDIRH